MTASLITLLFQKAFVVFATLTPIINAPGMAPIFLTLTEEVSNETRSRVARQVAVSGFLLVIGSVLIGSPLLAFFGGLRLVSTDSASTLPVSRLARCSFSLEAACSLIRPCRTFCIGGFGRAVATPPRSNFFRLEQQLPGGISSSHWIDAPFHGALKPWAESSDRFGVNSTHAWAAKPKLKSLLRFAA
jgi:hypothetical protein